MHKKSFFSKLDFGRRLYNAEGGAAGGGASGGDGGASGGGSGGYNPNLPPAGGAPAAPDFATLIPAEFKDKPWIKETKDLPSLFKRTDDLLTEIGKRPATIPHETSKPEEWAAFNKAFGVPEKPEGYEFSKVPDGLETSPEFQKGMQKILHEAGISARQFKTIEPLWNKFALEMATKTQAGAQALDKDFDKLAVATFGERKDKALAGAKAMIEKFTPESVKAHVGSLSNENLIILAGVIDGIVQKYVSEDQLPGASGGAGGATGEQAKRDEALKIMQTDAFRNPFDPGHAAAVEKVNAIYRSLSK